MIITHGSNSLPRGSGGMTVTIGEREYPIVQIGNQLWLAENLDFKFPGLVIGGEQSPTELRANYYGNNESKYGVNGNKYGLLYNWVAVDYLNRNRESLTPGWHVARVADWDALVAAIGGESVAGTKLKSETGWNHGPGTDDYGFSAFPAGYQNYGFFGVGAYAYFWTGTWSHGYAAFYRRLAENSAYIEGGEINTYCQYSVRLVKDA